jgi:hypothetical protein
MDLVLAVKHRDARNCLGSIYVTAPKRDASWNTFGEKDGTSARRFIAYKSHSALRIEIKPYMT